MLDLPRERVYERILKAIELGVDLGAEVAGLGAFTGVVGDGGVTIAERSPIPVTTGNSLTIAAGVRSLFRGARRDGDRRARVDRGRRRRDRLDRRRVRRADRAARRARRFSSRATRRGCASSTRACASGCRATSSFTTDISAAVRRADLVLTATSSTQDVIEPEDLRTGAVVCELSLPHDVSRRVAVERPDVLVVEGGNMRVPGAMRWWRVREPGSDFDMGLPRGHRARVHVGDDGARAREPLRAVHARAAGSTSRRCARSTRSPRRAGFSLADMRAFDLPISREQIARTRAAAAERRAAIGMTFGRAHADARRAPRPVDTMPATGSGAGSADLRYRVRRAIPRSGTLRTTDDIQRRRRQDLQRVSKWSADPAYPRARRRIEIRSPTRATVASRSHERDATIACEERNCRSATQRACEIVSVRGSCATATGTALGERGALGGLTRDLDAITPIIPRTDSQRRAGASGSRTRTERAVKVFHRTTESPQRWSITRAIVSGKGRVVKKVVSVSLGSSSRDHRAEVELLGERFDISRVGTDGSIDKAIAKLQGARRHGRRDRARRHRRVPVRRQGPLRAARRAAAARRGEDHAGRRRQRAEEHARAQRDRVHAGRARHRAAREARADGQRARPVRDGAGAGAGRRRRRVRRLHLRARPRPAGARARRVRGDGAQVSARRVQAAVPVLLSDRQETRPRAAAEISRVLRGRRDHRRRLPLHAAVHAGPARRQDDPDEHRHRAATSTYCASAGSRGSSRRRPISAAARSARTSSKRR